MQDRELYRQILGLEQPWSVCGVRLDSEAGEVVVDVAYGGKTLRCPECDSPCPGYDHQTRRWRHLDTCQYRTVLEAKIPRCECAEHGVRQIRVPWSEPGNRFTMLFERLAIDWMVEAGRATVARRMGLSWEEANGIMQRAVARGLARRTSEEVTAIGVDEKSFQKRHEYVTIVCNLDTGRVMHVADGRSKAALDSYYEGLTDEQTQALQAVAMDMHDPYVTSTRQAVPDATIVFDKFHIAKHLSEAVDKVRRAEHKELSAQGDDSLKGSRYHWLRNPLNETAKQKAAAAPLRKRNCKTARAWAIRETFADFWEYRYPGVARKYFARWYSWAIRSRLDPIKKVARMLKRRFENIISYLTYPITNATSESLNSKIQWIKYTARGFRSRDGFRTAIYFHCGGLDLYPH